MRYLLGDSFRVMSRVLALAFAYQSSTDTLHCSDCFSSENYSRILEQTYGRQAGVNADVDCCPSVTVNVRGRGCVWMDGRPYQSGQRLGVFYDTVFGTG